jgi:hypothetical protein
MFGFKMKLGLGNKVLLPEYGQNQKYIRIQIAADELL